MPSERSNSAPVGTPTKTPSFELELYFAGSAVVLEVDMALVVVGIRKAPLRVEVGTSLVVTVTSFVTVMLTGAAPFLCSLSSLGSI
jgi:hypothetical protein